MFDNHYMSKYQDVSILVGGTIPKKKNEPSVIKLSKIPYAVVKRIHLLSNEIISEDMTGYSDTYSKFEPCIVDIRNRKYFGMKKGFS